MKYKHGGMHYRFPDAIDYSANLNPFGMPEAVKTAAYRGIEDAVYYPDTECIQLREKIAEQENQRAGIIDIRRENIILGNGAAELIFQICHAIKPKYALLAVPTFQEYEQALTSVRCEIRYYELQGADDFQIKESFFNCLRKEIDVIFLCNPNNPTGQQIEEKILLKLLEYCEENQIILILDECFMEFCMHRKSMAEKAAVYKQLFILKAFTKLYAMPGLRLGYGISFNRELIEGIYESRQPWNISTPAQYAGLAALSEETYVTQSVAYIAKERAYMLQEIRENALAEQVFPSDANYILFKSDERLGKALLEKGFVLRNCSNYRNLIKGFYRTAVRLHEENVQLISAWKECVQAWQK